MHLYTNISFHEKVVTFKSLQIPRNNNDDNDDDSNNLNSVLPIFGATFWLILSCNCIIPLCLILIYLQFFCSVEPFTLKYV
jgi:hypothetical protein